MQAFKHCLFGKGFVTKHVTNPFHHFIERIKNAKKLASSLYFLFVCLLHGLFSIKLLYMKYLSSRSKKYE
ncbi:hypothetical protein DVW96_01170 [Enterococcus faecium]|nr:hypothetical protein DVW96_01170 [Enterococcus faecium]